MSAAEAVRIVADSLGVKPSEVIQAITYNVVIESIDEQIAFLREGKKQGGQDERGREED